MGEPLILCGDEDSEIAIAEAAQMVADSLGYSQPMQMDTSKADGQFKKTASNRKMRALWPDFEFTPMDQAIRETAEWFMDNYDTCRKRGEPPQIWTWICSESPFNVRCHWLLY